MPTFRRNFPATLLPRYTALHLTRQNRSRVISVRVKSPQPSEMGGLGGLSLHLTVLCVASSIKQAWFSFYLGSTRFCFCKLKIKIYRTIILPVVLYGCEAWSLTLREERKLRVFENTVLRRIFGPWRDEVTGEWRRLHNEELSDLYSSPNIVRLIKTRMRWAGHVARMGEERGAYRVLVGKPEGKRPLGRPRHRWVDNIRMDLQEVGCGYVDWNGLAQDRDRWRTLVSAVMNLRVP